jgi:hypothetical protein
MFLSTAGQGVIWEQRKQSPLLLFNMMAFQLFFSGTACVELCMAEGKVHVLKLPTLFVCSMWPMPVVHGSCRWSEAMSTSGCCFFCPVCNQDGLGSMWRCRCVHQGKSGAAGNAA